jgi:hypothetical protein
MPRRKIPRTGPIVSPRRVTERSWSPWPRKLAPMAATILARPKAKVVIRETYLGEGGGDGDGDGGERRWSIDGDGD